jgi:hypothetical protein
MCQQGCVPDVPTREFLFKAGFFLCGDFFQVCKGRPCTFWDGDLTFMQEHEGGGAPWRTCIHALCVLTWWVCEAESSFPAKLVPVWGRECLVWYLSSSFLESVLGVWYIPAYE